MEAAVVESVSSNHLNCALSAEEITGIPNTVADKINTYIDQKFEEYLQSKALFEASKAQIDEKITASETSLLEITAKYEEAAKKLLTAEETITELEKQIGPLNSELEIARNKITLLENEVIILKSTRDAAVDEKNDLTRMLERRNAEVERLTDNVTSLSEQLRNAINAKCEALALNVDMQSKELSLQYREQYMEQERTLLNSQIADLTEEVQRLTSELQTLRLNNNSRLINLETQLTLKVEELNAANETITQLKEVNKNLNIRAENLTQRLMEQREIESKMNDNYKKEMDANTKLADLFKTMHDDAEAKNMELKEGITELQKLLKEAVEKYGDLETKYKQAQLDHEDLIENKNKIILSLKNELEHANDLLKAAGSQKLELAISDLAPSAAAAGKLIKSGMTLTQVYSHLVEATNELSHLKDENCRLNATISTIIQELEEKAPMIQKQKSDYEEMLDSNTALTQQIDSLAIECNRLRDLCNESSTMANHYKKENGKLKGELADLGRQICFLLKEIEHSRDGLPNGDHDSSHNANDSDLSSSRLISKTLVTFSDIQELQSNNQQLLRMIRELTNKQEELEQTKDQFESGELQGKIDLLQNRVSELKEALDGQTRMVNGLIKQRDMFKKLYHDLMKGKHHELSSVLDTSDLDKADFTLDTSSDKPKEPTPDPSDFELKYREIKKHLELLKEEYKTYKAEKMTNERMLYDQIDSLRQEISKLTAANSKCSSTSEYNNERLKTLQTNIATYKKQITTLEEKNKSYTVTIAKQEVSLEHLRDKALNAESKLAAAETQMQKLKHEHKLLTESELRLRTENELLKTECLGQAKLLQHLELIKATLERVEIDNHTKVESRLDDATRECAALRRRLQEEQDRFRELALHLERETECAKSKMQEEKDAADAMRKEITQLREHLLEKNKVAEELNKELRHVLSPITDGSNDSIKKIKDFENKLTDKESEIKLLQEQLNVAKEHIKQYCDISDNAEKELKELNIEYVTYKSQTETKLTEYSNKIHQLEDKCSELEAELSVQTTGALANTVSVLKKELFATKEELKTALSNLDSCRTELDVTRDEISKLSEAVQKAEDKYTHEIILHSADIQTLSQVKEDLFRAQNQLNELVSLKNSAVEKYELEKAHWIDREKIIMSENEQLIKRLKELNDQNTLLHDQIEALGVQLVSHASRSFSESINESGTESHGNVSIGEEEVKSSEQLIQVVKFLRKEKDVAMAKFEILQAETTRIKSQLEISEKHLDEAKLALAAEREKSEVNIITINKQSDILRKVETLNALADSNRILREERDTLSARVEELSATTKSLEETLNPLQERIIEISSKNEALQSENNSLKADSARWRTRVNALVERANKTSPDDWKKLQNEREKLSNMLSSEKETVRKLNEELSLVKAEKSKIEEKYTSLSLQHSLLVEENKKLNKEVQVLKEDMSRLSEELGKLKTELSSTSDSSSKLSEELSSKDASLNELRNKELQLRKIAKKYKGQYEELLKNVEDEKKITGETAAAADAASQVAIKNLEAQLKDLQDKLDTEKTTNEKLQQDLQASFSANVDKEEKAKQVLKQAKNKIVQLTDQKNIMNKELEELRSKIEANEKNTRDEQDVRVGLIKSQYEGRLARLEKEKAEAQVEKTKEIEALQQKVSILQRQLANQSSASKQQSSAEKPLTEPPTANIKPMAGVAQQSVTGSRRGGEPPLASIRPMAQVGPTAPHDATHPHSTEYMPASSSRPLPRAAVVASTAPPESTQDMDTSEAGTGASDSSTQSSQCQTPQQAVALVLPRIEQPSGASSATPPPSQTQPSTASATPTSVASSQPATSVSTSNAPAGVSTTNAPPGVSTSQAAPGVSTTHTAPGVSTSAPPAGVSTSHAPPGVSTSAPPAGVSTSNTPSGVSTSIPPPESRPGKRKLQQRPLAPKRTRVEDDGFERSVDVEYQVPTSSRCDQEDEGVIVVDSEEDDERCTGTMYRDGEDDEEDIEEEQEVEAGEEAEEEEEEEEEEVEAEEEEEEAITEESPGQSPEEGEQIAPPAPLRSQIEAISSTPPSGALTLGGGAGDDGDDSIVPSTPTLYVPRRADGFGEAVVSPVGAGGARFTFAEAGGGATSHHDTHADLTPALPPHSDSPQRVSGEGAEGREWAPPPPEDAPAVSSQGSAPAPAAPPQVAEEGREAEASSAPRRTPPARSHYPPPHHHRWMRAADSESGFRGRGHRRGRVFRRPHNYR